MSLAITIMFALADAANTAPSAPRAIEPATWITPTDLSIRRLASGRGVPLQLLVSVDPKGRATQCKARQSSGNALVDKRVCEQILERGRWQPARDAQAKPVASEDSLALMLPPFDPRPGIPIQAYVDDDYPHEALKRMEQGSVRYRLDLDEKAHIAKCGIVQSSGSPSLDQGTCNMLIKYARFRTVRDDQGNLVRSSLDATFNWRLR